MAPSSSSSPTRQLYYEVFLSFRSEDTGNNFTAHLAEALCREKIIFFIQNQPVSRDEILNAIKASKIYVIIFSENYADSSSCLQELEQILECQRMLGQIVIPVFYNGDLSNLTNLTGTFGVIFSKLKERFKDRIDELERWKATLVEAANPYGTVNYKGPESELVEATVRNILCGLRITKNYNDPGQSMVTTSSSSSPTTQEKYDVFLSFKGEDTRNSFIIPLYVTLYEYGIKTFIDNQLIRADEEISSSLLNTIEASEISVIVFSENYADSTLCLQELEHILRCKRMFGQIVIPIFYNVDSSNVKNQMLDHMGLYV